METSPNHKNYPNRRCGEGNEREYHRGTKQSKEKHMTHQAQDGEMLGKQKSRSQDPGRQEQARREASRCCLGWRKFIHCKINPRCLPNIKKSVIKFKSLASIPFTRESTDSIVRSSLCFFSILTAAVNYWGKLRGGDTKKVRRSAKGRKKRKRRRRRRRRTSAVRV